jgi:RimJ/RimL family protein N-acetyltransferase
VIELEGERVVLRTLERDDCRHLWANNEPVEPLATEPLSVGKSIEGADQWFEEMQSKQGREQVYLGIFNPAGDLVGEVQLANIDWQARTATLGAGIARASDRGLGYATDAARTMIQYGFDELGLTRVEAHTAEYNMPARRVLQKLGFQQEGLRRKALYRGGRRWDSVVYGLLRDEFEGPYAG